MKKKLIFIFIFSIFVFFPSYVFAWDNIGYYAMWNNIGYNTDNCETSGRFNYTKYPQQGTTLWYVGQQGTSYTETGVAADSLDFTFRRDLDINKFYDIRIRFLGNDVRPYITADSITLFVGTEQCRAINSNQTDVSMISFVNKATTSQNSDYIQLRLYVSAPVTNWRININPSNNKQSTSTSWGIKDIIYREVDMSGNNAIIENNSINTNNIINNDKQNTQDIINNQNQNNQAIIDSNMSCTNYDKSSTIINGYLDSTGNLITNSNYGVTDYLYIDNNSKITINNIDTSINVRVCFYDFNKNFISCILSSSLSDNQLLTIPNYSNYVRFNIDKRTNKPQFNICKNGNQALNESITSDSIPSGNDYFDDFNDMLPSNNTISSLITLPISLYTKVLNSINGTCSAITLGSLYNTNLVMPCINLETYLGSTLFGVIDLIMSGGFVLIISKKMVKAFHNFTSMKEGDVINND